MASEVFAILYNSRWLWHLVARFRQFPHLSRKPKVLPLRHTTTITMPKDAQFKVFDLRRKNSQLLPSTLVKVRCHRLDVGEWKEGREDVPAGRLRSGKVWKATRGRVAKKKSAPKLPKTAMDVLKALAPDEWPCKQCGEFGKVGFLALVTVVTGVRVELIVIQCNIKCYREFKKQFIAEKFEIRGPGRLGYAAFTKPRVNIAKGQYIDEYVGDLRPIDSEIAFKSLYCFEIPELCVVDAERAGNWTRFINSSCRPNLSCEAAVIGQRHVIVFQALKDIGPEEELTFNYGQKYFKNAGFDCECGARKRPHKAVKEK